VNNTGKKKEADVFDIGGYRLTDEMWEATRKKPAAQSKPSVPPKTRRAKGQRFTLVPEEWSNRLADAKHIATFKVALHLLHHHWKEEGAPLTLANTTVKGVSRWEKQAALTELEAYGLITVGRNPRKSPVVRVVKF
jgi:hypothetical protein